MARYIAAFKGRSRGAIGIFYPITTIVEADSPEAARLKLYDSYEHLSGLRVVPEPEGTFYAAIIEAGIEYDHHESDLYVPNTPEVRALLSGWPLEEGNARGFRSNIDGTSWLDIPFAYVPYWEEKERRAKAREAQQRGAE